jgi:hypothetical protein
MSVDIKATTFVFPHETLTPIIGKPNHETVKLLRKELYAYENECTLGGGDNGYLGIIMSNTKYSKLLTDAGAADIAFVKPPAPDDTADAAVIASINKKILDYKAMEGHLKRQILASIEREYIESLDDDSVGFARVTAKALLEYIENKYDVITYAELSANRDKLEEAWDPSEPIHRLWSRAQQVKRFADAGNKSIDDDTIMHALLTVLKKTGVFTTHITIWSQKPENTWTMSDFQTFFDNADKERNTHTTKEAGYANAVKKGTPTTAASANAATSNNDNDKTYMMFGDKKIYYCWSHGGNTSPNHTSLTCNKPKPGHVNLATWDNTCGGCTEMMFSSQNKSFRLRNSNYNGNSNGRNNNNRTNNNNGNNNRNGSNNSSGNSNNGNSGSNNNSNTGSNNNGNQAANNSSHHEDN